MEIDGVEWEEISHEEWQVAHDNYLSMRVDGVTRYFKKSDKPKSYPHVFEDALYRIEVNEEAIKILEKIDDCSEVDFNKMVSFPVIQKAVHDAEKSWGLKEDE